MEQHHEEPEDEGLAAREGRAAKPTDREEARENQAAGDPAKRDGRLEEPAIRQAAPEQPSVECREDEHGGARQRGHDRPGVPGLP
jgi:hypothetical protein